MKLTLEAAHTTISKEHGLVIGMDFRDRNNGLRRIIRKQKHPEYNVDRTVVELLEIISREVARLEAEPEPRRVRIRSMMPKAYQRRRNRKKKEAR